MADDWSNRPLDEGWTMLPNGKGRVRPDGSIEWNPGEGPSGYDDATENQAAQTRAELGQIDSQQANRWDKFPLSNRPPDPSDVAEPHTRAWRDAFDKQQNWITAMAEHGASPSDLGFAPKVGQGLANFSRWGEITQNAKDWAKSGNWVDPNIYGSNPGLAYRRPDAAPVDPNAPVDQWPGKPAKPQGPAPEMPNGGFGGWSETHGQGVQLPGNSSIVPGTFNNGIGVSSVAPQYPQGPTQNTYNNFTPNQPARINPMNRNPSSTMGRGMIRRTGFGGGM
jgi:hypothetical protein